MCNVLEAAQVITQFLPPYSPDFNPIEEAFSEVKSALKAMENEMYIVDDLNTIVCAAFATITKQDCIGWIRHAGYCV